MDAEMTEADGPRSSERVARLIAFATLGALTATQELAARALAGMEGADPELTAEETLCLVATATARAAEVGLGADPVAPLVAETLLDLPFVYRDYLAGGAMLTEKDDALLDADAHVRERLRRKRAFYVTHLPPARFPGERALTDKMALWMGRISPPRLPEMPAARVARLGLVPALLTHLRLVLAFARSDEA